MKPTFLFIHVKLSHKPFLVSPFLHGMVKLMNALFVYCKTFSRNRCKLFVVEDVTFTGTAREIHFHASLRKNQLESCPKKASAGTENNIFLENKRQP